jgi:CRP-like cAMP-binding protein
MLTVSNFKELYNSVNKEGAEYESLLEFFTTKFAETSKIFSKFDKFALTEFINESDFEEFEAGKRIFSKNAECLNYYFILFGDINLYEDNSTTSSILIKTVSAGSIYGHKIKSTFNYFGIARNETHVMSIRKHKFDELIIRTNKRKENFKKNFLKKFFPKLRLYSDDIIESMKSYFTREDYGKNYRVLLDGQYEENIYLIISGEFGIVKSTKKLSEEDHTTKYIILEHLKRGELFGIYSAIKHQKNNYSVIVLSEKAEVYRISKTNCLYYFGGSLGVIPEALKGIDSVQQNSIENKLKLFNDGSLSYKPEITNFEKGGEKKVIDESEIENNIKDSWKELENLSSKVNDFKAQLFNKKENVLNKMRKEEEIECIYY